jgi:hypothetical protein
MNESEIYELHFCAHSHTTLHLRWIYWAFGGGTFVMMSWVGIFSQSFFFFVTLMRFGGLGFEFFHLESFFSLCEHL